MKKRDAFRTCRKILRREPGRRLFVYKVGSQWMYTGNSEAVTNSFYKYPVKEYQEVVVFGSVQEYREARDAI